MLAAALRRHGGHGAFHDLQQRLLHALARNVAGDRRIVRLAADLVDFVRRRNAVARLHQRGLVLLTDDVHAELNAFVADEYGGARDQFADLMLALATERAIQRVLGVARADLTHSYLRPPFDPVA